MTEPIAASGDTRIFPPTLKFNPRVGVFDGVEQILNASGAHPKENRLSRNTFEKADLNSLLSLSLSGFLIKLGFMLILIFIECVKT
ncbi:hypothetical protein [Pseudomonas sp. B329]|uniref:hypothetical protein n=1 Tax=Pseudomonas sp. B329 TaxID=1553459 RepID=UPI002003ACB7|nr:hypothetical protein [Pseudomonas sp. B329]